MSQEGVHHAAVPPTGAEKPAGSFKTTTEAPAQVKPTPVRGFNRSIDDAITVVEAEWKAQREHELAEKTRLESARQKALMVREIMILPLLNDLAADFARHKRNVLPTWEVQSGGDADALVSLLVQWMAIARDRLARCAPRLRDRQCRPQLSKYRPRPRAAK